MKEETIYMEQEEWQGIKQDINSGGLFGARWIATIIGAVALICLLVWGFTVLTSNFKGQGDANVIKNSGTNRIAAQQYFEQTYNDIKASDRKIVVARDALKADPSNKTLQVNLNGTINYCIGLVGDYNAAAKKYSQQDFRPADLPSEISSFDLTTDCK